MAHYAEINEDNIVTRVLVVDDEDGEAWLNRTFGGRWLQTSYNTRAGVHTGGGVPLRGNFAGIGMAYSEELDAFIPPRPYIGDWTVDPVTFSWVPVESVPGE